ncbi:unnamed protein product, partial [Allacma fusca]
DFTIGPAFKDLPAYVQELKSKGIKFIPIQDPCISSGEPTGTYRPFDLGNELDIWIKKSDGTPAAGSVWTEAPCYFPDYSKQSTREWWNILIKEYKNLVDYAGIWIDMNEPTSFAFGDVHEGCSSNSINDPP